MSAFLRSHRPPHLEPGTVLEAVASARRNCMRMRGRLETKPTEGYIDRTFGKRKKPIFFCFSADRIHAAA